MTTSAPAISAAAFPAVLEGPDWLREHPEVRKGTLAYACEAKAAPFEDRAKWGRLAAEHYRSLPIDAVKAMEPTWLCTQADPGRKLSTGELVGGTVERCVAGLIAGRFDLGRDVELLSEAVDPCRDVFLAGKGPKLIPVNAEPWTDPGAYERPETLKRVEGESETDFAERQERARLVCLVWDTAYESPKFLARIGPEGAKCPPSTWGDIRCLNVARVTGHRAFHMAKVATIRAILKGCGLLVPGVTVVPSFGRNGSTRTHAFGVNDEPVSALTAPRDEGVSWASNWQFYGRDWRTVAQASAFLRASAGPVIPTIWSVNADTASEILKVGCRGGVIWYVDEDLRAKVEGRETATGEKGKSSEDWMANEASRLTRLHRETLR